MGNMYLLYAPGNLIENINGILDASSIGFARAPDRIMYEGRKTTDLIKIRCFDDRAEVDVAISKRRSARRSDLLVIPRPRSFFWPSKASSQLAERILRIMYDHGATDA